MSELQINPAKTALVLIDLQNGILSRDTKPHTTTEVVERSAKLADAFRTKGSLIVYVRVNMADFMRVPADEVMQLPKDIPAAASEIAAAADMQPGDVLVTKRHWGAFAGTNLEEVLRARGVETVVLGGIATNIGVESTLRQGTGLGFAFITVEDICTTFSPEMQAFAFTAIFPRLSNVTTTDKLIAAIA
jgi:nicotinamidase-related amidase